MNICDKDGPIEIRVDRRTELLGTIQIISNYKKKYPKLLEKHGNKKYVEETEKKFNVFKNHKVVKLFDEIVFNNNFGYDAPVSLFLQLNDDFTFDELDEYPYITRLNSDPKVIELLKLLPDFVKEINFNQFYKSNISRYSKFISCVKNQVDGNNIINYMKEYYGLPIDKEFVVNLIPFQTNCNYGSESKNHLYSNISCNDNSSKESEVYLSVNKVNYLPYLIFHEFSHSFINPITDKYNLIDESDDIFSDIFEQMNEKAYGNVKTIINEHIIRALTLRYKLYINRDIEVYNKGIKLEEELGFIYIKNVLDSLIFYENSREKYKNINEYYPEIIKNIVKGKITKKF